MKPQNLPEEASNCFLGSRNNDINTVGRTSSGYSHRRVHHALDVLYIFHTFRFIETRKITFISTLALLILGITTDQYVNSKWVNFLCADRILLMHKAFYGWWFRQWICNYETIVTTGAALKYFLIHLSFNSQNWDGVHWPSQCHTSHTYQSSKKKTVVVKSKISKNSTLGAVFIISMPHHANNVWYAYAAWIAEATRKNFSWSWDSSHSQMEWIQFHAQIGTQ